MKKIVLLSLVSLMTTLLWATDPGKLVLHKPMMNRSGAHSSSSYSRNNTPSSLRAGTLQKVRVGSAGNLLSILNANCHQIDVDSTLNTVLFIHRSDLVSGNASANVAQYRYDISKDGGTTWNVNIGPLNPAADNITINGRYPEAVIRYDSAHRTSVDSAMIVYNGSWHNGASPIAIWQGQYYGVGKLDGDTTTYTEHYEIVNNANVEISTSMIQSIPGHYWNLNLDFTQLSTTTDSIRGIIIERGLWNDSAKEVLWTYQNVPIPTALVTDASGNGLGNNLGSPTIAFDPTGRYGWILMTGDLTEDANFVTAPILMSSSDYGATWTAPYTLYLDNLPGMFPTSSTSTNEAKTVIGSPQITVDAAGNPHIAAVIGMTDTTSSQYEFFPFQEMDLYDLYYNPAVSGCSWQANFLSTVFGYDGIFTSDNTGDANRVQISRSHDGTKIFIFWNDSDSSLVASIAASATGTTAPSTNTNPNLYGIGIDMTDRKLTDKVNFTVGDALFGGVVNLPTVTPSGTFGGALFPVVSPNAFNRGGGVYNIPVVLTQPDYNNSTPSAWLSTNPAAFYYCQNINFTQSQFVNRFDNAPPTLTVNGPDTVYVRLDSPYIHPTASAHDCVLGNITPQYSSNVPLDNNGNTDSVGVFTSTWTATNQSSGNTATFNQTVIVSAPPIAMMQVTMLTAYSKFAFTDVSLNFPTNRIWYWGDGTSNNLNQVHATKVYSTGGVKCVILKVSNQYGTSSDTVCIQTYHTGINDVELSNKINVFPNPSSGIMTLEMEADIAQGATVTVINILGEAVNAPIEIKAGITSTVLDLKHLDSGAYMLKIETATGTAIKTIAINK